MGFIYKITNTVNNKVYIGQTTGSIMHRFKQHEKAAKNNCNYKFHRAIRKYGIENFKVEQVEECDDSALDEKEMYWVKYYSSYSKGYNSTKGGKGLTKPLPSFETLYQEYVINDKTIQKIAKEYNICEASVRKVLKNNGIKIKKKPLYDYKEIAKAYKKEQNERKICAKFECSNEVVKRACKKYGVPILSAEQSAKRTVSKRVYQIDLKTGKIVNKFSSVKEAGIFMGDKNRGFNISAVCRGKQKTAFGYYWSYSKDYTLPPEENQKKKKVRQLDKDGNLIKVFDCVASAAEALSGERDNSYSCCIASCARGLYPMCYGYKWEYER